MKGSCLLAAAVVVLAWVQPLKGADLFEARKIMCRYCSGTSVDWYQKKPQPMIVLEEFVEKMCPDVLFTDIDRNTGTAVSREEDLESAVTVWESPRTLSFMEISYGGAMIVTTIFLKEAPEKGKYLSVRSDHTFSLDFPVPVQFFGACEVLERE